MTEIIKNDPEMLRSCILYEFLEGIPSFETFKKLCRKFGEDFMDYPEFEFWYMRFAQGKYDLDYDRSSDPKTRLFTDLPVEIFEKIGDSLNLKERFALRKVSKDIQVLVDSWIPRVTVMEELNDCWYIKESFILQSVDRFEKSNENIMSLFKNPKLRLDSLKMCRQDYRMKNIIRVLERSSFYHKINVKNFDIRDNFFITPTVLKLIDLGTLEKVSLVINRESVEKLDEFLSSEHLKGIKMLSIKTILSPSEFPLRSFQNYPRLAIKFYENNAVESELVDFIKNLVNSTQLQICHLSKGLFRLNTEPIMREFQLPETMVPGFPNLRRYPIHGSNEFYEIEFSSNGLCHIGIERKQ